MKGNGASMDKDKIELGDLALVAAIDTPAHGIRTKQQERQMFRAVKTLCAVFDQLQTHEQQAWLNWLQSHYGTRKDPT